MTKDIYVPAMGETVKIGEHTHSYTFTLGDSLVNSVHMAPFEDFVVGHAIGTMKYHEEALVPTFEIADARAAQDNTSALPTSLYIGDMKLTALKARLIGLGLSAEFGGQGVLICWNEVNEDDGAVAISKNNRGELNITSSLIGDGDIYYTVREAVYGMHAVIPTPA